MQGPRTRSVDRSRGALPGLIPLGTLLAGLVFVSTGLIGPAGLAGLAAREPLHPVDLLLDEERGVLIAYLKTLGSGGSPGIP